MSTKIDANRGKLEASYQWLAFKVNPLVLMGCIVVPLFVGSYAYTSWQQTKNPQPSSDVEIKYLPLCSYKRPA
ncbi:MULTISPECIES: hypothetical protein [unclassified Tolypothrix]|uniref:hypothetical protein n=1 Tax=unclassified Tolypothrix TaxID=2649714 RepID=UPI0005EAA720|nr:MULTISPECIES: hypothetical protein [unclassified Tolypothrix]BAY95873.1 hypothetical protein NIES3275_79500 [Microchaete diplosiphon NIES-3275]EKE96785.1 hypothetical protein FDUTEX481_06327 [Tolypothrix sp. PCC 7601]MBE9083925.1 hypothetical protein [Tolypothrix sp. LEGE 11397]UYD30990.1 hypothetical protein HGR01_39625 [Tolypothrix sp. PCC 7712]UYD38841.1 hypothetical protein HG267_40860 [Tolypothrix sp. PCC 7601]